MACGTALEGSPLRLGKLRSVPTCEANGQWGQLHSSLKLREHLFSSSLSQVAQTRSENDHLHAKDFTPVDSDPTAPGVLGAGVDLPTAWGNCD